MMTWLIFGLWEYHFEIVDRYTQKIADRNQDGTNEGKDRFNFILFRWSLFGSLLLVSR